jgi:hypothetical protein
VKIKRYRQTERKRCIAKNTNRRERGVGLAGKRKKQRDEVGKRGRDRQTDRQTDSQAGR